MRSRVVNPLPMPARRALGALATAIALSVAGVATAWAQAAPATPSSTAPAAESPACSKAKSKVAREQRSVDKVQRAIDRARADSTTCTTKPVCDHYVTKIEALEARRARRVSLLARNRTAAAAACSEP